MAVSLFVNAPSCKIIFKCKFCNDTVERYYSIISANFDSLKEGFHKMEEAIENLFCLRKRCCKGIATVHKNYGPHLIVDTELGEEIFTPLHSVPLELNLSRTYKLAGIVAYSGIFRTCSIGHYTAYVKMSERWIQFDDMSRKGLSHSVADDTSVHVHLCMYILK